MKPEKLSNRVNFGIKYFKIAIKSAPKKKKKSVAIRIFLKKRILAFLSKCFDKKE